MHLTRIGGIYRAVTLCILFDLRLSGQLGGVASYLITEDPDSFKNPRRTPIVAILDAANLPITARTQLGVFFGAPTILLAPSRKQQGTPSHRAPHPRWGVRAHCHISAPLASKVPPWGGESFPIQASPACTPLSAKLRGPSTGVPRSPVFRDQASREEDTVRVRQFSAPGGADKCRFRSSSPSRPIFRGWEAWEEGSLCSFICSMLIQSTLNGSRGFLRSTSCVNISAWVAPESETSTTLGWSSA